MNRVLILSFITIASIVLDTISFGSYWLHIKPFWLLAFYVIYVFRYQTVFAFYNALVLGVIIDIASSNILGQTSFALIIATGLLILNVKRIQFSNVLTYFMYVLIICILYFIVLMIPHTMIHGVDVHPLTLVAPLTTAVLIMILSPLSRA